MKIEPLNVVDKAMLDPRDRRKYSVAPDYIQITVPSDLYDTTQACGTPEDALEHGLLPCGDGCDYTLTETDKLWIHELLNELASKHQILE